MGGSESSSGPQADAPRQPDGPSDKRLPVSTDIMPLHVYFLRKGTRENSYVVEYQDPGLCLDGRMRKKIFYAASKRDVPVGSAEANALEDEARIGAWKHIDRHNVCQPFSKHGRGPLSSGEVVRFHGFEDTDYSFYVNPPAATGTKLRPHALAPRRGHIPRGQAVLQQLHLRA